VQDVVSLHDVRVGHPYALRRNRSSAGAEYAFRDGDHELTLFVEGPDDRHVESVTKGEAEFAMLVEDQLLVFLARFGDAIPWIGACFWWHLVPRAEQKLPQFGGGYEARALLATSLVDAETELVRARRCTTLSLDFSRALNEAILEQAHYPFDPSSQRRSLTRLLKRYPNPEAMVAGAKLRSFGSK
jgi:hypothetical protein